METVAKSIYTYTLCVLNVFYIKFKSIKVYIKKISWLFLFLMTLIYI